MKELEFESARRCGKSLAAKQMINDIFKENPNAKVLLLDKNGSGKIVVSDKNTEIKPYPNEQKLMVTIY